jgi:hypothetical protein
MDGVHDVGGKLGFGAIKVTHDELAFCLATFFTNYVS